MAAAGRAARAVVAPSTGIRNLAKVSTTSRPAAATADK